MALVIKKTIKLDSLGEEYAGIVLDFKSIPASDLPELISKQSELGEETAKVIPYFIEVLENYFLSGMQNDVKIESTDLGALPSEALVYVFQVLSGQSIDPKAENESTNSSITESAEV